MACGFVVNSSERARTPGKALHLWMHFVCKVQESGRFAR